MTGAPDANRGKGKPFLIQRTEEGYRLFLRETRYNSQNYPFVTTTDCGEIFASATAARTYARTPYGAEPGEFASK